MHKVARSAISFNYTPTNECNLNFFVRHYEKFRLHYETLRLHYEDITKKLLMIKPEVRWIAIMPTLRLHYEKYC